MYRALSLLLVLLASCTAVDPQPIPVLFGAPVAVNLDSILIEEDATGVTIEGEPEALDPGGATVQLIVLERTGTRSEVVSATDGSFSASLPGASADASFRLQTYAEGHDAAIFDLTSEGGRTMELIDADCAGALAVPPEVSFGMVGVGADITRDVPLGHGCAEGVTVTGAVLLGNADAVTIETATPVVVPSGGAASLTVRWNPAAESDLNDILLLELDGHRNVALTLSGLARSP